MTEWTDFYDGARHPDDPDPADHDDVPPIVWAEWQADRRRVSSGDAPPQPEGEAARQERHVPGAEPMQTMDTPVGLFRPTCSCGKAFQSWGPERLVMEWATGHADYFNRRQR